MVRAVAAAVAKAATVLKELYLNLNNSKYVILKIIYYVMFILCNIYSFILPIYTIYFEKGESCILKYLTDIY